MCFSLESSLKTNNNQNKIESVQSSDVGAKGRRIFLGQVLSFASVTCTAKPVYAIERAVGSSEKSCREEGNCLEKFDLDGAVGWNWGGKERCDA